MAVRGSPWPVEQETAGSGGACAVRRVGVRGVSSGPGPDADRLRNGELRAGPGRSGPGLTLITYETVTRRRPKSARGVSAVRGGSSTRGRTGPPHQRRCPGA
uniref:Uncharacterized protein sanX n=1 Tax=Streptomyces sp. SANK 61196 TaxID=764784 RepID=E2EKL4_9ACTN|nr:hypothetical protein [Streptomyces sp. SANK 61196]